MNTVYGYDTMNRLTSETVNHSNGEIVYYHADSLGSIVALTDSTGAVAESYTYTAFGEATIRDVSGYTLQASGLNNRFMFTGREWDAEAELYHYRARAYCPELGRFVQFDPIDFDAGDLNAYRYVGNGVLNWVDPFGKTVSWKTWTGLTMWFLGFPIMPLNLPLGLGLVAGGGALIVWDLMHANSDPDDVKENWEDTIDQGDDTYGGMWWDLVDPTQPSDGSE